MNRYERVIRDQGAGAAPSRGRSDADEGYVTAGETEPAGFDLPALLRLIRRRKWSIIVTTVLGVAIGALYVSQVERQYTARAAVVVDTRQSDIIGLQTNLNDSFGIVSMLATEVEILRSSSVLLQAAEVVNLPSSPVFDPRPTRWDSILSLVGLGDADETVASEPDPPWNSLSDSERFDWAGEMGRRLSVSTPGNYTSVITLAVTTPVATESAGWVNAIAQAYIDQQVLLKFEAQQQAAAFYRDRVRSLAVDVEAIESQIDNLVFDAIDQAGTPNARATLTALRSELGSLESQRAEFSDLNAALINADADQLAGLVESGLAEQRVALLETLDVEANAERAAAIQADIAALDDEIRAAALARANSIEVLLAETEDQVADLQVQLNFNVTNQTLPNDVLVDVFELQQDAEATKNLYTSYLTQLRQAEQNAALALPDARIISFAATPGAPSYPSVRSTLLMALILSGAAGVGLAFLRENLIGGIAAADQFESVLGIPVVSVVPRYKGRTDPSAAMIREPMSQFSEAIRRARLGVETYTERDQINLLVTSAAPGDGKTTVALAIARSFAESGRSTILVDADLRRPSVNSLIEGTGNAELSDFLDHDESSEAPYALREKSTGLYMLLRDEALEGGTDTLLLSEQFQSVVDFATRKFECVVYDSSPVGPVVDACVIAREYATAVLFVLKANSTPQRSAKSALRELRLHADIPVVGLLNQANKRGGYYGKYSGYYYSSAAPRTRFRRS